MEKQFYLTPEEADGFEESGRESLDLLYRRINSSPTEYEGRFIEQ